METKKDDKNKDLIEITFGNQLVTGRIVKLDKYYIEIEILSPFINWKNFSIISGPAKMSSYNFLVTYEEVSKRLLSNSFRKLKIIDESIDRIVKVYNNMTEELKAVNIVQDEVIRERIIYKLNDWFFHDFLFTSSVTGLIASNSERAKIEEIISTYENEQRKIYLS
jgi:hypothetical protein